MHAQTLIGGAGAVEESRLRDWEIRRIGQASTAKYLCLPLAYSPNPPIPQSLNLAISLLPIPSFFPNHRIQEYTHAQRGAALEG
jgi:hypothetical protein